MSRNLTYFLSDIHLGARFYDNPLEKEKKVVRFLDSIKEDAKEIYLLGDILDYWYEYRYVVPRGFVRFFGKLAELADAGVRITWLIGNHDIWIFDYLPNELGIEVIDGSVERVIDGKRFYLAHGDGVGKNPASFKFIRYLFRNKLCQKMYAGIHPRWTIPLAYGWSRKNRKAKPLAHPYVGNDKEPLVCFARQHHSANPDINYYIFGHRHIVVDESLSTDTRVIILGEWIDLCSYAVFDGQNLQIKYFRE